MNSLIRSCPNSVRAILPLLTLGIAALVLAAALLLPPNAANAQASTDAKLSGLALSLGANAPAVTLSPSFDADTTSYTTTVGVDQNLTVTATPNDSSATVSITDGSTTVASSEATFVLGKIGLTTITVTVTAADATTTKSYTVDVTREFGVSFDSATYSVAEGGTVTVALYLDDKPGVAVTVTLFAYGNGGATSADYSVPLSATFGADDDEAYLTFSATDDDEDDDDESVTMEFGDLPTGLTVGAAKETLISITDDDESAAPAVPTISGTAQVGETLTADISDMKTELGLEDDDFWYTWLVSFGVDKDGMESYGRLSGGHCTTLQVAWEDVGEPIWVQVRYTDADGNTQEVDSARTDDVVAPASPTVAPTDNDPTGLPLVVTGVAAVGQELTIDVTGLSDSDGLTDVDYCYTWHWGVFSTGTQFIGATGETYTLTNNDLGMPMVGRVLFNDNANHRNTLTSERTASVAPPDLTLSALTISPTDIIGFASDHAAYEVGVASTVTQATITATTTDSNAVISYNPTDADTSAGATDHQVDLVAGKKRGHCHGQRREHDHDRGLHGQHQPWRQRRLRLEGRRRLRRPRCQGRRFPQRHLVRWYDHVGGRGL